MNEKFNKQKIKQDWDPFGVIVPSEDESITKWYNHIEKKLGAKHKKFRNRLFSKKICFVNFSSPASTLLNFKYSYKTYKHPILLDVELLNEVFEENIDEIFPILLHEIGHIFNVPEDEDFTNKSPFKHIKNEYYADDFVRSLGFENELLICLEKYKKWKLSKNLNVDEVINLRIKRIKDKEPINKGINIDTYNKKTRSN